jgi:hypothetical protein
VIFQKILRSSGLGICDNCCPGAASCFETLLCKLAETRDLAVADGAVGYTE